MALLEQHSPSSPVLHNLRRFTYAISPTAPTTGLPSGASFQIFLGGGRDGLASEESLIGRGVHRGGGGGGEEVCVCVCCKKALLPREHFLILSYFMCFLKPHEQGISAKIRYKN